MIKKRIGRLLPIVAYVWLVSCSGGGEGASGTTDTSSGKASTQPLVLNLVASPSPAWLNAAVTFTVTCQSVIDNANNASLKYIWSFGDGATETTDVDTDEHTYTAGGNYTYSVQCQDGSQSSQIQAPKALEVKPYDLNAVSTGTCSTGVQGIGWCWQRPLPTGNSLRAVNAVTALSGWAVGDGGEVLATDDGGQTWTTRYPNTAADFVSVISTDHNHVAVTATDASIWSTTDNGLTWNSVAPASGSFALTEASMSDLQSAWGIQSTGIVRTSDGGKSWNPVQVAGETPGVSYSAISAGNGKSVWAVGNIPPQAGQTIGTGVTASTADGTSWAAGASPLPDGMLLNTVSVTSGSRCEAAGNPAPSIWLAGLIPGLQSRTAVYSAESLDGGRTWGLSNTGGGSLIAAFDANTAFQTLPSGIEQFGNNSVNLGFGVTNAGNSDTAWQFPNPTYPFYAIVPQDLTAFPTIHAMDSADCVHGWAVGDTGTILSTTNGGKSWVGQAAAAHPSTTNNLVGIVVGSPTEVFALAVDSRASRTDVDVYWSIIISSDGGKTWISDNIDRVPSMHFSIASGGAQALPSLTHGSFAVNSMGDIVAVGPGFVVNRSLRAGHSWDYHTSGNSDEAAFVVNPPLAASPATSWGNTTATGSSEVFAPRNVVPDAAYEVWRGAAITNSSAWAIDGLGDVIEQGVPPKGGGQRAGTGGWTLVSGAPTLPTQPAAVPAGPGGRAIAAVDLPAGPAAVIVGSSGLITRSTDLGHTWTPIAVTNNDLEAVNIVANGSAAGLGWAVGANGTILRTTDGGATWAQQAWPVSGINPTNVDLVSVSSVDGQAAWIVAHNTSCSRSCSFLLRTEDGGATWSSQATGAEGLSAVLAVDQDTGWLIGTGGKILKTVTRGVTPPSQ